MRRVNKSRECRAQHSPTVVYQSAQILHFINDFLASVHWFGSCSCTHVREARVEPPQWSEKRWNKQMVKLATISANINIYIGRARVHLGSRIWAGFIFAKHSRWRTSRLWLGACTNAESQRVRVAAFRWRPTKQLFVSRIYVYIFIGLSGHELCEQISNFSFCHFICSCARNEIA